jgi:hypothetical protein
VIVKPSNDNSAAFQVQNAAGSTTVMAVDTSANKLTVTNLVVSASMTVNGHIVTGNSSGSTTAAVNANAGTSATCTIAGNDSGGQITLVTGFSGPWAAGVQCTITFASSYSTTAPHPVISPANATDITSVKPYSDVPGTSPFSTWTLNFINADTSSKTYKFNYFNAQ